MRERYTVTLQAKRQRAKQVGERYARVNCYIPKSRKKLVDKIYPRGIFRSNVQRRILKRALSCTNKKSDSATVSV